MPWIQFNPDLRSEFARVEGDWMRANRALSATADRTPTVPGATERMVTPELAQFLTERGFPFVYV